MKSPSKPELSHDLTSLHPQDVTHPTTSPESSGNLRKKNSESEATLQHQHNSPDVAVTQRVYLRAARKLGVLPHRAVMEQFGKDFLAFADLGLTQREMKATCLALVHERQGSGLDVSGNSVGSRESEYLIAVLTRVRVRILNVANNCLRGPGLRHLSDFVANSKNLTWLNLSNNKLSDRDAHAIADLLLRNSSLRILILNHNEFGESGGQALGTAIGRNQYLEELELRWNHIRRYGAISIAKGLQINQRLQRVDLAWNGFGFEGCVALGDVLARNHVLRELDVSCNRIHPPALMELVRGLVLNKILRVLKIGNNPITASFTSVLMNSIRTHPTVALQLLDMQGVVVDRDFQSILDDIRQTRNLHVNYDVLLPVKSLSREEMLKRIQAPGAYNLDPLHMFYLLKEKMRASDFFHKINKDNDERVSREELNILFQEAGIPVTGSVIDKIIDFMDTNGDGSIDISEFMTGDKKMKRISRNHAKISKSERKQKGEDYSRYSRSFKQAHVDPITSALKVDDPAAQLPPVLCPEDSSRPSEH